MRTALQRVRLDNVSTTKVSVSSGIPTRTLRRYVNYSKDPNSIFFIEEPEQEFDNDDEIVSWRPGTAVPMFKILSNGDADVVSDDADPTFSGSDVGTGDGKTTFAVAGTSDISVGAGDNVSVVAGDDFSGVAENTDDFIAAIDAIDFTDITGGDDGLSLANVFDHSDFDHLFQDFLGDDMFTAKQDV